MFEQREEAGGPVAVVICKEYIDHIGQGYDWQDINLIRIFLSEDSLGLESE